MGEGDSAKVQLGTGDPPPVDTSGGGTGGGVDITTHFQVTKLTADHQGEAKFTEPPLKDVWGVTSFEERFWGAAQETGLLIGLDAKDLANDGQPTGIRIKLDNGITGIATNDSDRLQMDVNGKCDRVQMIVASETGRLWGVNTDLSKTEGVVLVKTPGAQYTGVAIIQQTDDKTGKGRLLVLAADFHRGHIDVFNDSFHLIPGLSQKFMLTDLPKNFSPFGIMALEDRVVVTYAERRGPTEGEPFDGQVAGDGKGLVAAFDLNGKLIWRTPSAMFNVPWGMAMGNLRQCATGALLIGQHGLAEKFDGENNKFGGAIIAMDARTGKVIGALKDGDDRPVRVQGLWGLTFGTEISTIDQDLLHMGAGPVTLDGHDKGQQRVQHGLFARLDARAKQDP